MTNFEEPRRFWSKVDVGEVDECWEWLASKTSGGRGTFWINKKLRMWSAYRVAWTLTFGPIPKGLCVCHKCDNKGCCNPYHLFLGTNKDNLVDAVRKGRLPLGEKVQTSKLTEAEVLEIRKVHNAGEWTHQELADEFGVDRSTISYIIRRDHWGWLEED